MTASRCPHYLEFPTNSGSTPEMFECLKELNHKGKHKHLTGGEGIGPRPQGGRARKGVNVLIEWER